MTLENEHAITINKIFKPITVKDLNYLGYELTGRELAFGNNKSSKISIMEVRNEDKKGTVDFCFAYSMSQNQGIILPASFDHYVRNPIEATF